MLVLFIAYAIQLSSQGLRVRHEHRGLLRQGSLGFAFAPRLQSEHALVGLHDLDIGLSQNVSDAMECPRPRMRRLFMKKHPTGIDLLLIKLCHVLRMPHAHQPTAESCAHSLG